MCSLAQCRLHLGVCHIITIQPRAVNKFSQNASINLTLSRYIYKIYPADSCFHADNGQRITDINFMVLSIILCFTYANAQNLSKRLRNIHTDVGVLLPAYMRICSVAFCNRFGNLLDCIYAW